MKVSEKGVSLMRLRVQIGEVGHLGDEKIREYMRALTSKL